MTTEAAWRTSCLPFTLHEEGGLSLVRKDLGNWTGGKVGKGVLRGTKYGIAAASHPTVDIAHLTLDQASDIYWREYVAAPRFDALPLPLLFVVFEASVNCGPVWAGRWTTEAQRDHADLRDQIAAVTALSLAYHRRLKTWSTFGGGWSKRIAAAQKQALLLVAASPTAVAVVRPAPQPNAPRPAPKPAHQPAASGWTLFWRGLADALFQPVPKGARA